MSYQALINRCSNVSLDVYRQKIAENGALLQQWNYNTTPNQNWELVDTGDGYVWLRNQESGKALDVYHQKITENGAPVQQWDYLHTPNQQWKKNDLDGGWFWLSNRESGKSLDIHVYDIAKNGARVQQWDYHNASNQQWRLGGDKNVNKFDFGEFEFTGIGSDEVAKLFERHRFAYSQISACGNLTGSEKEKLTATYKKVIKHGATTRPGINGSTTVGGDLILINFGVLFPQGDTEIAQTLIHEMMHCAGFTHPDRLPTDSPYDGGVYYNSEPLRAEMCIAGQQSDTSSCLEHEGFLLLRS